MRRRQIWVSLSQPADCTILSNQRGGVFITFLYIIKLYFRVQLLNTCETYPPLDDRNILQQTQETQRVFKNGEVGSTLQKKNRGAGEGGGERDGGGGGGPWS